MRLLVILSCIILTEPAIASNRLGGCSSSLVAGNIEAVYAVTKSDIFPATPVFCFSIVFWLCRRFPIMSSFNVTAITIFAPSARQAEIGTGFTSPPSISHLPLFLTAGKRPGTDMEAKTASRMEPLVNQISLPVCKSVATEAYFLATTSSIAESSAATYFLRK